MKHPHHSAFANSWTALFPRASEGEGSAGLRAGHIHNTGICTGMYRADPGDEAVAALFGVDVATPRRALQVD